jgi:hypothetical protein
MSDRLARVIDTRIEPLTVFAEDGTMVAFRYDSGGYGWAERKTFVSESEALRVAADRDARRELLRVDEAERVRAAYREHIARAEAEADRLRRCLNAYEEAR